MRSKLQSRLRQNILYNKLCDLFSQEQSTCEILIRSLKLNYMFFTSLVSCLYLLTKCNSKCKSYINTIVTFIIVTVFGWWIHYFVHKNDFEKMYIENDDFMFIKNNWLLNKIANSMIYWANFHDKIHHDTDINKQPFNWVFEFSQNFIMEGGLLLFFSKYFNISLHIGRTFKLNNSVLLLWALLYSTVHNINYIILGCDQHEKHHINPHTNYGIDTLDILFGTKYEKNNIENLNHASINLIVITSIILFYKIFI